MKLLDLQLSQDTWAQPQGYPLQRPLTPLEPEDARTALDIYKLVCRSVWIHCLKIKGHTFTLVSFYDCKISSDRAIHRGE